ncbi:high-affinity branched-chain amino acid transport system permease protein LivH [Spirochaetota bacterium]|nr:high-affinity branched-chain amino acid transport system permease protein LivH [Spirochaetota bacterium]
MEYYIQFMINGLITGSIYAVVAAGFSLIYNTHKFVHFAHGAVVMVGGYLFHTFFLLEWNIIVAALMAAMVTGGLALGLYQLTYAVFYKKRAGNVILLMASIALLLLINNVLQLFYGAQATVVKAFPVTEGLEFWGAIITPVQIIIIAVSLILLGLLYILMTYTQLGKMMRAVADNDELSLIIGIPRDNVKRFSFFIGSFIGALGGVLVSLQEALVPSRGTYLIIKGFTGAVIGGIESVPASIIGSYLLGFIENISIIYLPSDYKITISFGLLFLFLIFSPGGLYALFFKDRVSK